MVDESDVSGDPGFERVPDDLTNAGMPVYIERAVAEWLGDRVKVDVAGTGAAEVLVAQRNGNENGSKD
ncbi:MAG: hypothetical protein Kow0069_10690 [Promethearchaeota archaeon]